MSASTIVIWSSILVSEEKAGIDTSVMRRQLADDIPSIVLYRLDQDSRKVFWINIYNAFFIQLTRHYKKSAREFTDQKDIIICRVAMSLDDIERKILCGYRSKYFRGRFKKLRVSEHLKKIAVDKYDPRIHFALCRGVKHGPEIICYNNHYLEKQLTYSAGLFLESNIEIDHDNKKVVLHKYFDEYYNAIGGKKEIYEIVYDWLQAEVDDYEISYKDFNPEPDIIRYADDYHLASFI